VASFTPRPLYPRGNSPRYPLDRNLGGHRAGQEDVEKRKVLTLPYPSVVQPAASRYTDCAIPAPFYICSIKNVKLSLQQAVKANRVETSRLPHFLLTIGSQVAVRLPALRTGRPLPPRNIPGTHFCYRLSRPQGHSAAGRVK
jgi:hypothetical protein